MTNVILLFFFNEGFLKKLYIWQRQYIYIPSFPGENIKLPHQWLKVQENDNDCDYYVILYKSMHVLELIFV